MIPHGLLVAIARLASGSMSIRPERHVAWLCVAKVRDRATIRAKLPGARIRVNFRHLSQTG